LVVNLFAENSLPFMFITYFYMIKYV